MTNERTMEHWVLKDLQVDLALKENPNYWIIPQGNTKNPLINQILEKCGGKPKHSSLSEISIVKKGIGKGRPEYIFVHKSKPLILLVECKSEKSQHRSENLDKPSFYNLDGLLYYAKYFKEEFEEGDW